MTEPRTWNERLGWIAADGTIEREAQKEPPMTTDELCRRFTYRKGSILSPWRDIRKTATGDCQSFAFTVLIIETGSVARALLAMLTFRAVIWRAYSPVNGAVPRHAVLWLRGKGYIDSSDRYWRPSPKPHRPVYPAGLPVLIAAGAVAKWWGLWAGML